MNAAAERHNGLTALCLMLKQPVINSTELLLRLARFASGYSIKVRLKTGLC